MVVLPLPDDPAISACLVSDRSGTATSLLVPDALPSRMTCPVNWYAAAAPNRPRRTGKPGTVPSTAIGKRNAQLASRASPSTPSIASCGSGGS